MLPSLVQSLSRTGRSSMKPYRRSSLARRSSTPCKRSIIVSRPSTIPLSSTKNSLTIPIAFDLCSLRSLATKSTQQTSQPKSSSSESGSVDRISTSLISMINKDGKIGKNDIRTSLKQLKVLEPNLAAQVLKNVSLVRSFAGSASKPADTADTSSLRESSMGPILEESLARLVEVGFEPSSLPSIFLHLSNVYPEWRSDGWDNVIERYIINKGFDIQATTFILGALPQDLIANFQVRLLSNDVIAQYYQRWKQEMEATNPYLGTPRSPRWPAEAYASILTKLYRRRDSLDELALAVAFLASNSWNRSAASAGMQPIESLNASLYFAAVVIASIVGHLKPMTNQTIASLLTTFNGKIIQYLKESPELVAQGFNTFEYLEWVSILIAEVAKQRASKFNDIFMIKASLDKVLEKWGSDDVGLVSQSISKRFSVGQWIRETVQEWKSTRQKA